MLRIVNRLPLERRILLLYWSPAGARVRASLEQHLRALRRLPGRNHVVAYNASRGAPGWLRTFRPDAIVLHTTFLALRWIDGFETRRARSAWIGEARCTKLALPQDDYDHAETLDGWLEELGVDAVLTALPEHASTLYPRTSRRAEIVKVLTGYVDEDVVRRRPRPRPLAERPLDVVYRATKLPFWFGSHGQLKHDVGAAADTAARRIGLRADISMDPGDAIVGGAWLDFLASGVTVVGCETGSSALDRAGELRRRVSELLREDPNRSFAEVSRHLPAGWDDHRFFALGPRHLEAATTGTAQVLVEGEYDGVLEPNRHYLPVRRDLSDLEDALARATDAEALQPFADAAYEELCLSEKYSYQRFGETIERALREHGAVGRRRRTPVLRVARKLAVAEAELERRTALVARAVLSARSRLRA